MKNGSQCGLCFIFFILFLTTSCARIEFYALKTTDFSISSKSQAEKYFEYEGVAETYFWGKSPRLANVDLDETFHKNHFLDPSYIGIEQHVGIKSALLTFLTLGLYCPIDYKITLRSKEDLR